MNPRFRMRRVSREENDDALSPFGTSLARAVFDNADFDEDIERANKTFRKKSIPTKRFGVNSTCLRRCRG